MLPPPNYIFILPYISAIYENRQQRREEIQIETNYLSNDLQNNKIIFIFAPVNLELILSYEKDESSNSLFYFLCM